MGESRTCYIITRESEVDVIMWRLVVYGVIQWCRELLGGVDDVARNCLPSTSYHNIIYCPWEYLYNPRRCFSLDPQTLQHTINFHQCHKPLSSILQITNPTMPRRSSTSSTSSARRGNTMDDENDNRPSRAPQRKSPDRTAGNPANFRNRSREEVSEIGRKGGHNSHRGDPGRAGTGWRAQWPEIVLICSY